MMWIDEPFTGSKSDVLLTMDATILECHRKENGELAERSFLMDNIYRFFDAAIAA